MSVEMNVAVGEGYRRLPIYLLLDCSGSMRGSPIEAVRLGVEQFARDLKDDRYAEQTANVAIITFDSDARMVTTGLVPAPQLSPPKIDAGGSTNLAKAFEILLESIDRDLRKAGAGVGKGDWRPLVFILTDGAPDAGWEQAHRLLVERQKRGSVNVITVGCGTGINESVLRQIGVGGVFKMDATSGSFRDFFEWVTRSVKMASRTVSSVQGAGAPTVTAPAPPTGFVQFDF